MFLDLMVFCFQFYYILKMLLLLISKGSTYRKYFNPLLLAEKAMLCHMLMPHVCIHHDTLKLYVLYALQFVGSLYVRPYFFNTWFTDFFSKY